MKNNTPTNHGQEKHDWWSTQKLIADLQASATQKYFLTLVFLHTNRSHPKWKGKAWTTQAVLAEEMGVTIVTVERCFRWAKKSGIVEVQRIRHGKLPSEQYNVYNINLARLAVLAHHPSPMTDDTEEHPSPMTGDATEHPSPVSGVADAEHPSPVRDNTHHLEGEHPSFEPRTPITSEGEAFKDFSSKKEHLNPAGGSDLRSQETSPPLDDEYPQARALLSKLDAFLQIARMTAHPKPVSIENLEVVLANYKQAVNACAMPFAPAMKLYDHAVREFQRKYMAPPVPIRVEPPPPCITAEQVQQLRDLALKLFNSPTRTANLQRFKGFISSWSAYTKQEPASLTPEEWRAAMDALPGWAKRTNKAAVNWRAAHARNQAKAQG